MVSNGQFWTVDTVGEGVSGRNGESSINIYTLSCARWIAGEKLPCSTGSQVWYLAVTWGCVYNYGWFTLLYGRNQHGIVKIKKKIKRPNLHENFDSGDILIWLSINSYGKWQKYFFLIIKGYRHCISLAFISSLRFVTFLRVMDELSMQVMSINCLCCAVLCRSVVSVSLQPHGLQPARLLCPCGFSRQEYWSGLQCPPPGKITSM